MSLVAACDETTSEGVGELPGGADTALREERCDVLPSAAPHVGDHRGTAPPVGVRAAARRTRVGVSAGRSPGTLLVCPENGLGPTSRFVLITSVPQAWACTSAQS